MGMALDVIYSRKSGWLEAAAAERVLALLRRLGFELFADPLLHVDAEHRPSVLQGLEDFREHLGGELTLTMLKGIGDAMEIHEIIAPRMLDAISELRQYEEAARKVLRLRP